jgi:hypothetical protein
MKQHISYLKYVLRHKSAVWRGGRIVGGVPLWHLLIHDWDKFLPGEWLPYVQTFYKPDGSGQYVEHQKRNRHHWQYWLLTWDRGETTPLPIPEVDVREMIADWIGAGWVIAGTPDPTDWYEKNKDKMTLHPETRMRVEALLADVRRSLEPHTGRP